VATGFNDFHKNQKYRLKIGLNLNLKIWKNFFWKLNEIMVNRSIFLIYRTKSTKIDERANGATLLPATADGGFVLCCCTDGRRRPTSGVASGRRTTLGCRAGACLGTGHWVAACLGVGRPAVVGREGRAWAQEAAALLHYTMISHGKDKAYERISHAWFWGNRSVFRGNRAVFQKTK
jgi:hypothetical protein